MERATSDRGTVHPTGRTWYELDMLTAAAVGFDAPGEVSEVRFHRALCQASSNPGICQAFTIRLWAARHAAATVCAAGDT